jgi:hypothetical protein
MRKAVTKVAKITDEQLQYTRNKAIDDNVRNLLSSMRRDGFIINTSPNKRSTRKAHNEAIPKTII